mgnify:CR=1 FL=1
MISFQFETYIADGAEHYSYGADYGKGMVQTSKTVSFPESLLSLVDMNIDEIEPAIRQLNEVLWQLTTTREKQYAEEVTHCWMSSNCGTSIFSSLRWTGGIGCHGR